MCSAEIYRPSPKIESPRCSPEPNFRDILQVWTCVHLPCDNQEHDSIISLLPTNYTHLACWQDTIYDSVYGWHLDTLPAEAVLLRGHAISTLQLSPTLMKLMVRTYKLFISIQCTDHSLFHVGTSPTSIKSDVLQLLYTNQSRNTENRKCM
jgi:hypothetical protein